MGIEDRAVRLAEYIIERNATVRAAAKSPQYPSIPFTSKKSLRPSYAGGDRFIPGSYEME